jgi:outer membrane receptor protein involved in Fe transport
VKANLTARYDFDVNDKMTAFLQGALVFNGRATSDLRLFARDDLGPLRPYTTVDLSAGVEQDTFSASVFIKNAFDSLGQVYKYTECTTNVCENDLLMTGHSNGRTYVLPIAPLTIGVKFGQKF